MSTATICDSCHEKIVDNGDRITLRVEEWRFGFDFPRDPKVRPKPPEPLSLSLDLHRSCYVERYLPALKPPAH